MSDLSKKVFLDRYALKGENGELLEETPDEMWRRVAKGIAKNEKAKVRAKWEKEFYQAMKNFKFVPAGRILSGAGTGYEVTYFNCFVIPSPQDSRHGILKALGQLVEIQARSGGVGLNLSSLRPRGARVKKVNGTSSGPVNWAELFSVATHDIVQQGGSRRGATMLMIWDWHPDVEEFITVKQDLSKINGANLSVCISDSFMKAVKEDADWDLVYPDLEDPNYDDKWDGDISEWKEAGRKVKVYKTVKARYLWNLICKAAWQSAEPGLHFLERSNKRSNTHYFEKLVATNPCGEQPLGGWAVCNLGAMNLASYVENETFDFESFTKDVKTAIRLLDNVIDQTYYFFPENEKCAKDIRRTGLGIMGLGDALIKMKLRYGSEEAEPIIEKIFKTLRDSAYEASSDLAKEKGSFPKYEKDKYQQGYHIKSLPKKLREKIYKQGIRNAVLLTIAPTGTTSLVSGVTSGIEPVYEFEFLRRWRGGEQIVYHHLYKKWKDDNPDKEERPDYFVSANDLTPEDHVSVQAIAQKYIDSSISKTVNAPNAHTVEDVQRLYMMAYDEGLKGITYMRDGSRQGVLERVEEKKEKEEKKHIAPIAKRPGTVYGFTREIPTPIGDAFVTVNSDEKGSPFEIFINAGKSGSDVMAMAEALGRMMSMVLRLQGPMDSQEKINMIAHQLAGIGGARTVGFGPNRVRSLPDAVARVLAEHYRAQIEEELNGNGEHKTNGKAKASNGMTINSNGVSTNKQINQNVEVNVEKLSIQQPLLENKSFDICPDCGEAGLVHEEGCKKCYSCGYAEC